MGSCSWNSLGSSYTFKVAETRIALQLQWLVSSHLHVAFKGNLWLFHKPLTNNRIFLVSFLRIIYYNALGFYSDWIYDDQVSQLSEHVGYKIDKDLNKQMEMLLVTLFPSHIGTCSVDIYTVAMMTKMETVHGFNYMIFLHRD